MFPVITTSSSSSTTLPEEFRRMSESKMNSDGGLKVNGSQGIAYKGSMMAKPCLLSILWASVGSEEPSKVTSDSRFFFLFFFLILESCKFWFQSFEEKFRSRWANRCSTFHSLILMQVEKKLILE